MLPIELILTLTGLGLIYFTLALLLNRSRLRVSGERLSIWHGPLPFFRNRSIPASEIDQVFVDGRHVGYGEAGAAYAYPRLNVLLKDGRRVKLLNDLKPEGLRRMERMVEERLGIEGREVEGEWRE